MVQELITFIIIGAAVTFTIIKTVKKFSRKKRKENFDFQNSKLQIDHNCSDCSAECMLRNTIKPSALENNAELCKKVEIKSK